MSFTNLQKNLKNVIVNNYTTLELNRMSFQGHWICQDISKQDCWRENFIESIYKPLFDF